MSYLEDREKKAIDKMKFDLANRKFEEYPKFVGDVIVNSANGKGVSDYKRGMDLGLQLKYKF